MNELEIFEIHLTSDNEKIHEVSKEFGIKTITIDNLKPDHSVHSTEHMTSFVYKCEKFTKALEYVYELKKKYSTKGVEFTRMKIECPYYEHYLIYSSYIESHWKNPVDNKYPLSKNQNKPHLLATDRTYSYDEFAEFRDKYKDKEVELCLYDTNDYDDLFWFDHYPDMLIGKE